MRSHLRYRTIYGGSVGGLSAVISSPVQWKLASLPRALNPDEAQLLLGAFTGTHVLRHTLACRLVENGSSLKEVADVLPHRFLETTRTRLGFRSSRRRTPTG